MKTMQPLKQEEFALKIHYDGMRMRNHRRIAVFTCRRCEKYLEMRVSNAKRNKTGFCLECDRKIVHPLRMEKYDGISKHPFYKNLDEIKQKCMNKKDNDYAWCNEGGTYIYELWIENPRSFIKYIVSLPNCGYKNCTLERVEISKGYEPGNLHWKCKK